MHFGRLSVQFGLESPGNSAQTAPRRAANLHKIVLKRFQLRLYPYHLNAPCPLLSVW